MNITEDNLGYAVRWCFMAKFKDELVELLGECGRVFNELHHIGQHAVIQSDELASDFIVLTLYQGDSITIIISERNRFDEVIQGLTGKILRRDPVKSGTIVIEFMRGEDLSTLEMGVLR